MKYILLKRIKIIILILLFSCKLTLILQAKNVVFDLGGVLFHTKTPISMLCKQLSITTLVAYMLHPHTTKYNIKGKMLAFLDKIKERTQEHNCIDLPVDDQGNLLPLIMHEWLAGSVTSHEAITHIRKFAKQNPTLFNCAIERKLMLAIMHFIFNPNTFAQTQQIHPDALKIVQKLKKDGYKIYILSNWDKESFVLIQEKHKELFTLFDGIMISGEEGMVKPSSCFYKAFLNKYNLDPKSCIFIDDQKTNIIAAQTIGMNGFVCPYFKKKLFLKRTANLLAAYKKIIAFNNDHTL
ncbi:HAD family hydrolase [Candidatus Dependentiae bacterium]|nr:MAG: HAD family hydrolase [Candidatus Dependentiae bacterium]